VYYAKTAIYIVKILLPPGSLVILFYEPNARRDHPTSVLNAVDM